MDALLRELQPSADGIAEYQDTDFSGDQLTIGSAANSTIQLLGAEVAPEHAVIKRAGSVLEITTSGGHKVLVNGEATSSSKLQPGDLIELGGHKLRIARAPSGFDFAVEIEPNPNVDSSAYEKAFRTEIEQALPTKRRLSWTLLLLVLLVTMAIPLTGVLLRHHGLQVPGFVPSDASWSTGPLIPAHQQATGDRCDHCHKTLFVRIRDTECRECHSTTADHATPVQLAKTHFGEPQRCASCHLEHNESASDIVVRDDTVCTACHSRDAGAFGSIKVAAVTAFEPKSHPEFKPQLLRPMTAPAGGGIALDWRLESLDREGAHEQSNLKFSHVQHLDSTKVTRRTDGNGLGCADCHKLNADGEHFAPITMASSCSSCHELTFDPAAPDRQLPHGKPREVVLTLQEYFARKYSDPAAAPVVRERRRLPGREQEEIKCAGSALECARSTAAQEIGTQFAKRGCVSCHAVVDTHSTDIYERYQVYPVRLAADYYPHMHFDHEAHRIQKDKRGDAACLNCHTANKSEESADLLVPGISSCLECHRSRPHGDQVAVQCVSCHAYHPRKAGSP